MFECDLYGCLYNDDGMCHHKCPCVGSNRQCSSYEKYERTY